MKEKITIVLIVGILAFCIYSLVDNFRRTEICEASGGVMVRGHLRYVCIDKSAVKP